ncbi:Prepilin-type cleavage/methylation-like protein [Shewanella benthica]|uniref:Prepilin-type cleavage/methylation-like protein n=1 Tax=Shewanella benthica TaxID=43661 RepID=A0A330M7D0_9GAMM|nr:PilW family protein [Shewanella benthica]SQH75667.1 Prepilin-type cleavage/methylation-like protein [Shewanella benthica]
MFSKFKGFSLVELMVAMVISLFLSAGLFSMFSMSSRNVITTSQFNQLQENGRIALALIERDVSQLGFMGDITGTDFIVGVNTTVDAAISGTDCIGAGLNNASLPNTEAAHFRTLWGYENGVSTQSLACLPDGVRDKTDVLQIKRFIGPSVAAGDDEGYYVSATSSQAIFFNNDTPSATLTNARIWEYQHHVYFIANDDNGIPVLRRKTLTENGMTNDEQLVEGIENMRILYGFDNDGDSTPDSFMPVQNVTSDMWDQVTEQIVALRIYLLVRATEADTSYTNNTVYTLGDKTILAANDDFRRKVVSTTIVLKNPVLIR